MLPVVPLMSLLGPGTGSGGPDAVAGVTAGTDGW